MNISLAGRRALATGANSGIGQALALGDAGADVVVNCVTHPEAADAASRNSWPRAGARARRAPTFRTKPTSTQC